MIVACQKSSQKDYCRWKNFFVFLDRKISPLMIHPSIQIAYKYHYPSSTNANYSQQEASQNPLAPEHHFHFDIFTCFSHVNLNFVSQDIRIQMCVNIITCEKLFTAPQRADSFAGGKKMWKEKEIPSHNRQRKKKKWIASYFAFTLK